MAISAVPFALQNGSHSADLYRQAVSSLVLPGGGVVTQGDFNVTQTGTPSMSVSVGVGRAWVPGTNVGNVVGGNFSKQAMYFALNDAAVTLTVATSDSTNPRVDLVYLSMRDSQYSGSLNSPLLGVVTGSATSGASYPANAPSLPANAIALAAIVVPANANSITNSNITYVAIANSYRVGTFTSPVFNTTANTIVPFGTFSQDALSFNNDFVQYNNASGQLKITKGGIYSVTSLILPAASPGLTSSRIRDVTAGVFWGSSTGGNQVTWEVSCTFTRYLPANTVLEFSVIAGSTVACGSNITVVKVQ